MTKIYVLAATLDHDIVVLDLDLPDINGLELIKELRGDFMGADVPVVVLSNSNDAQTIDEAYRLGALAYYVKEDVPPIQLAAVLDGLLGAARS